MVSMDGRVPEDVLKLVGPTPWVGAVPIDRASHAWAMGAETVLLDVDLSDHGTIERLRQAANTAPAARRVFLVEGGKRAQEVQAIQLGAEAILRRPLQPRRVARVLGATCVGAKKGFSEDISSAVEAGHGAMQVITALGRDAGASILQSEVREEARDLVASFDEIGLDAWVATIKSHHDGTFRHCLSVTGIAMAFARHLRFREADVERLTTTALLHDVGKARIPLAILDKPGRLNAAERAIMERHPVHGREILEAAGGYDADLIDVVAHHHELLDGSGYPDRLSGAAISDLVRISTICDIFGALIEPRAYKPPMPAARAYAVLEDMGDKLDRALVRAFRAVSDAARF